MAEAVTISDGDTLTKILKTNRGLKDHEVYSWLRKLRPLNPHIGDLNRIFPGESVLIPDSYQETVSDDRVWQNAFKGIPRPWSFPTTATPIYFGPARASPSTASPGAYSRAAATRTCP
jgi:hypothetical protein